MNCSCSRLIIRSRSVIGVPVENLRIFALLRCYSNMRRTIVAEKTRLCFSASFVARNKPCGAVGYTGILDCQCHTTAKTRVALKVDSAQFHAIFTPEVKKLIDIFIRCDYELRIVGGAVRDLLLGKLPQDIDFATKATPAEIKKLFTKEKIRIVENRGECHGTITARINEKQNFEITTLHSYTLKDGCRPEVKFTTDWELDSNRRDLTVNSMFLGLDGVVYDYCGGIQDLKQRKVRFVHDAEQRIQEDYLRILRYFRFYGHLALTENSHDPEALEAIRQNVSGLADVYGKRLWFELKKILSGNHSCHLLKLMIEMGLAPFLGLPKYPNVAELDKVWARASMLQPRPMTILVALMTSAKEFAAFHKRMKLPSYEYALGLFLLSYRGSNIDNELLQNQAFLDKRSWKTVPIVEFVQEVLKYQGKTELLESFSHSRRNKSGVSTLYTNTR